MKTRLVSVALVSCLVVGCSLNTQGMGGEAQTPDIETDQSEPDTVEGDIVEPDVPEVAPEDAAEEQPDDALDEPNEEEVEPDEFTDTSDAEEAEDAAEAEDEGDEEDGEDATEAEEFFDPCAPPDIPSAGLWLFFCLVEDGPVEMVLWRWIRRDWAPYVAWEREPGCSRGSTTTLWCPIEYYHTATFYFNIEMPGLGIGWSCGPGISAPYGTPRVWLDGIELPVRVEANGGGGCNHTINTP